MLAIAYRFHYYQIDMSLGGEEGAVAGRGLLEVSLGGRGGSRGLLAVKVLRRGEGAKPGNRPAFAPFLPLNEVWHKTAKVFHCSVH